MTGRSLKQRIKTRLLRRADNIRQNLTLLLAGCGVFMLGFALMAGAEFLLKSSIQQELFALLGLILAIGGAILAAFGYISLSVLRLFRYIYSDNDTK